ncbi:hypothetical protein DFH28DRAFT_1125068 [Melampsora americana]|nr:hypothetical protein DFH28DRAFT_1125068 [Melampsora americana]
MNRNAQHHQKLSWYQALAQSNIPSSRPPSALKKNLTTCSKLSHDDKLFIGLKDPSLFVTASNGLDQKKPSSSSSGGDSPLNTQMLGQPSVFLPPSVGPLSEKGIARSRCVLTKPVSGQQPSTTFPGWLSLPDHIPAGQASPSHIRLILLSVILLVVRCGWEVFGSVVLELPNLPSRSSPSGLQDSLSSSCLFSPLSASGSSLINAPSMSSLSCSFPSFILPVFFFGGRAGPGAIPVAAFSPAAATLHGLCKHLRAMVVPPRQDSCGSSKSSKGVTNTSKSQDEPPPQLPGSLPALSSILDNQGSKVSGKAPTVQGVDLHLQEELETPEPGLWSEEPSDHGLAPKRSQEWDDQMESRQPINSPLLSPEQRSSGFYLSASSDQGGPTPKVIQTFPQGELSPFKSQQRKSLCEGSGDDGSNLPTRGRFQQLQSTPRQVKTEQNDFALPMLDEMAKGFKQVLVRFDELDKVDRIFEDHSLTSSSNMEQVFNKVDLISQSSRKYLQNTYEVVDKLDQKIFGKEMLPQPQQMWLDDIAAGFYTVMKSKENGGPAGCTFKRQMKIEGEIQNCDLSNIPLCSTTNDI